MSQVDLIHVAEKVFKPNHYQKVRPAHKVQTAQVFLEKLGFPKVDPKGSSKEKNDEQPITLLELGAGTGKFTNALSEATKGTRIKRFIASEPVESMSKVLQETNPGVEFKSFRAENIPLPDSSVHAVVSADAMHYFSTSEAFSEICRVLVPGGVMGILYKEPNIHTEPWTLEIIKESAKFYQQAGVNYDIDEEKGHESVWGLAIKESGVFHELEKATFDQDYEPMHEGDFLEYIMSLGSFCTCSKAKREELRERYRKIIHDNNSGAGRKMTAMPFKSFMYWAKKK